MPGDLPELDRLDLQHKIVTKVFKGHCPCSDQELDRLLRKKGERQTSILDLGRGSGIWAIEMAERYPESRVVGLDLVDSEPLELPSNCTFVTGDMMTGLTAFQNQFDLVHIRLVLMHMKSDETKKEALEYAVGCLRPGGMIVIVDYDETFTDDSRKSLLPAQDGPGSNNLNRSWATRFIREMFRGNRMEEAIDEKVIEKRLAVNPRIDNVSIRERIGYVPLGWDGGDREYGAELGKMGFMNSWQGNRAMRPALLARGIASETVDAWIVKADQEINGTRRLFIPIRGTWGRRVLG
ncbi:S-adenosyl-L-methionine-dependent methyltransferase [Sistotremastrum niveocremeum HHB9708]|uniref:S-adenosyl-L-methionine-dependent methyltransferase n=2 Tax=Sistotremastraceae TaxID=3402574 RepID=A0A164W4C9_9AGAM|nr:S-adenosyl-L-methionine-dependent methyltransferase [Sistotremastrum niveocremeum HHB9708]KZT41741.1 S-adenosyl-L-methionine-dependent methyltransferase [Sistotremastrum suecicum HHB10207 ss-3]